MSQTEEEVRLEKIAQLREKGINPFAYTFDKSHSEPHSELSLTR